jgi:uncharacterized membrane protein YhaH (DUF805 family)
MRTYFSFKGRIPLKAFWLRFNLWYRAVWLFLWFFSMSYPALGEELKALFFIVTIWPYLAVVTKRFHDRGKSIWYWLSLFILSTLLRVAADFLPPWHSALLIASWLLAAVIGIEAQFMPGEDEDNRFGPDPLAGQSWDGTPRMAGPEDMRRAMALKAAGPPAAGE